ncbi:hypothetical protein OAH85_11650, partial [Paracoccaceae bacterium]|nr:hypothetical protein [Paracoccaceae bacterium]
MISIGTNASALMAQAATASVQIDAETAMQRLSSGKRINAAKDDAAGVAIASRMTSHVRGLHQSIRNSMDVQALISTAQGGLQETEVLLQRIRELAVQASNDTNSDADRTNLNNEAQQLLAGIDAVASGTTWAGQNLLDGTYSNKSFQVGGGSMAADQVTTSLQASTGTQLGLLGSVTVTEKIIETPGELKIETRTFGDNGGQNPFVLDENIHTLNGPGSYERSDPDVMALQNGNFVAVWVSATQDGDGQGIYARIVNANGDPVTDEFLVNRTNTINDQFDPEIIVRDNGDFYIIWTSLEEDMPEEWDGVMIAGYSADGTEIGINRMKSTSSEFFGTSFDELSDGKAAAVWSRYTGRIYQSIRTNWLSTQGSEVRVSNSNSIQKYPSLTALDNDRYVIVWEDSSQDGSGTGIFAQMYSNNGSKYGSQFRVNDETSGNQSKPQVEALSDGRFVVTWEGSGSGDSSGIYYRTFANDGSGEFNARLANSETSGSQTNAGIAVDPNGGFFVTWKGTQSSQGAIYGAAINSSGHRVNHYVINGAGDASSSPKVSYNENNSTQADGFKGFTIVWQQTDGTATSIKSVNLYSEKNVEVQGPPVSSIEYINNIQGA